MTEKILLTGGNGFLGQFVKKELIKCGFLPQNIFTPTKKEFDFTKLKDCQKAVKDINIVIHLAAKVGGIGLNQQIPGKLFYDNLIMGAQLMEAARQANVKKFVAIGTVCAYPKFTPVPFKEENLWNGYPEETNSAYGLAKKMLLVQAQAYRQQYGFNAIYLLPVNLYGPGDNFDPSSSHVIPALIKKAVKAKKNHDASITVWGTGTASREFLYVEDAARAIVSATLKYNQSEPINIGFGTEITIKNLVSTINKLVGFKGQIIWDKTKPDGQPRRCLDTSKALKEFGFQAKTDLKSGLQKTIDWYLSGLK
jgi:GDP-L-fucose synthase